MNIRFITVERMLGVVLLSVWLVSWVPVSWATELSIAVIETAELQQANSTDIQMFKEEVVALFAGDRDVQFSSFPVAKNADAQQVDQILQQAYKDPKTDLVLVLDLPANQQLGRYQDFKKPTFLPFAFNGRLLGFPLQGETSGRKNLNYITRELDFETELNALKTIVPFQRAVLIGDPRVRDSVGEAMLESVVSQAKQANVALTFVSFNGDTEAVLAALPYQVEAVLYGIFPMATTEQVQQLLDTINEQGIPGFALSGEQYVQLGALATNESDTDMRKLARRTAIHMQEVVSGTPAATLPVFFESTDRLMINMATARQLKIAPSFDVLGDAVLINKEIKDTDQHYSLTQVAREAVEVNLILAVERLQAEIAQSAVKSARAQLLPQITASLTSSERKDTAATRSGEIAESTTDGAIGLTMPLFSESIWAAYSIQKYSALAQEAALQEVELDIVQSAVTAYLNVLREKTSLDQAFYNLDIVRENYHLAKDRVQVGTVNASDLYRWESELANAKQRVLSSRASYVQQQQSLNQLLDRPIDEIFTTTVETLNNPDLIISDQRILALIQNENDRKALENFFVEIGIERAPELAKIRSDLAASQRQLSSDRRAYWVPDLSLSGQYTDNLDEERAAGGAAAEADWQVGVELSLPLFEGGARLAESAQSRLRVRQLQASYRDSKAQIEQAVRAQMASIHASYNTVDLSKTSEIASQKSYQLVSSSYAQGAQGIVDVLDAQEALISAREASMNAVYTLLIDLMNVQRSIGAFDFFLTDTERMTFSEDLITRMNSK